MCTIRQTSSYLYSTQKHFDNNKNILSLRFPQKLWKIINECDSDAIRWGSSGKTILLNYAKFQAEYLNSKYPVFKTKNITSFIRQLNLYGFRKLTSNSRYQILNPNSLNDHEFIHERFQYGRLDMLPQVSRKNVTSKSKSKKESLMKFNRISCDVVKAEQMIFERKPKQRILTCWCPLKEALERAAFHCRDEKCIEMEDPLADIVDSNSTDAVSELFGFEFNAIPNAEASMEWINNNYNLLSTDYIESEEIFQHMQKSQCQGNINNKIKYSKHQTSTSVECNPTNPRNDDHKIIVKLRPQNKSQINNSIIAMSDDEFKMIYQEEIKTKSEMGGSSMLNPRNLCITLLPNKINIHKPIRGMEIHDNFYLQLKKAYRLF